MKIILFANLPWTIYNFRLNLIRNLVGSGHEVHAISSWQETYSDLLSKEVASLETIHLSQGGKNLIQELATIREIFSVFKKINPDAVFTFTIKCNLYTGLYKRINNSFIQVANINGLGEIFNHKNTLSHLVKILYKISTRNIEHVLTQNDEDYKMLIDKNLVPQKKLKRIFGSGVDLEKYQYTNPNPNRPKKRVLIFGRVVPEKGHKELITMIRKYPEILNRFDFIVLGVKDLSRHKSSELWKQLEEMNTEGRLSLMSQIDDVRPVLHDADCVILPSYYNEGVPRCLLEALSSGKPIITTDWKGCRETVIEHKNGFLIPTRNVEALKCALEKFHALSEEDVESFGKASRELAESRYDEKGIIQEYYNCIQKTH